MFGGPAPTHFLGVVTQDAKYVYWPFDDEGFTPTEELFDVANDPGETANLLEEGDHDAAAILARNAELQRSAAQGEAVEGGDDVQMTLAECEQLRMLGYVEDCSDAVAN